MNDRPWWHLALLVDELRSRGLTAELRTLDGRPYAVASRPESPVGESIDLDTDGRAWWFRSSTGTRLAACPDLAAAADQLVWRCSPEGVHAVLTEGRTP